MLNRRRGGQGQPPGVMSKIPKVILLIESSREAGRALLRGIANYAHHHGPWSFYWEPAGLERAWPLLREMEADGIILRDVGNLDEVLGLHIPAVVVGHQHQEVGGLVNVVTDSRALGRMAAEHLLSCGFRHFAFCGYSSSAQEQTTWSGERHQAFSQRVAEAGFEPAPDYVLSPTGSDWPAQRRRLAAWLKSLPTPVGLLSCNDDCGAQVMEACKDAGLTVPDSVGVIGADNDELVCGLSDPPMSSVAINFERAGYEAAHALERLMRKRQPVPAKIIALPTHIVTRRSTDIIAVSDPVVARALRFIRDHPGHPIRVEEVAKLASLSRRTLERRFRRVMGCSVLHQIRRVRSDEIARLLLETQLPVGQIAARLGFADVQHFARYFRATRRTTPLAFRRALGKHPAASG